MRLIAERVERTPVDMEGGSRELFRTLIRGSSLGGAFRVHTCATGLGRDSTGFASIRKTEISAHAKGAHHHFPFPVTVVDIGGQDTKVIELDGKGRLLDFKMNRKCAAGTGAFLEEIAERLGIPLEEIDPLARKGGKTVDLGSYCTVFTKTEILARMREGEGVENLLRGVLDSIVKRVVEMTFLKGDIVLTGGVIAHNGLIRTLMEKRLGREVLVPPSPQTVGALGAALFAREEYLRSKEEGDD